MLKNLTILCLAAFVTSCGQKNKSTQLTKQNDSLVNQTTKPSIDKTVPLTDTLDSKVNPATSHKLSVPQVNLSKFIPDGYCILDATSGDLNLDQFLDEILILKKNGEDSTSDVVNHPEKRPLLILLGQPDSTYKLAARSDNAVYCVDCGGVMGDPYQEVVIKNGFFSIEHYGGSNWRWTRTITFKFSKADNYWYLHKDGGESFQATDPEKTTEKVQTTKDFGKVSFDKFDIYK